MHDEVSRTTRDALGSWLDSMWHDGRSAVRSLVIRPSGFVARAGTLGLAVGITTAMFALVDAVILRPVPFKDSDRLAHVFMGNEHGGSAAVPPAIFHAWRTSAQFAGVEGARSESALVGGGGSEVTRSIARVTPGLFDLLGGVQSVRGRLPTGVDSADVVLISEDVWRGLYHSDPTLVGQSITLNGEPVIVAAILSSEFRFPTWDTVVWRITDFADLRTPSTEWPVAYVRLSSNVPVGDALRVATTAAREADQSTAALWAHAEAVAEMQRDAFTQRAAPLLVGGILLLFVALCANVSSLTLVGVTARRHEFELRSVLGASPARLARQTVLEGALTGTAAVLVGAGLARTLVSVSRAVLPVAVFLHSLNPPKIGARPLIVASIAGLIATIGTSVLPAVIGARSTGKRALQLGSRGGTETPRARLAGRALLVCQIAVSSALLFGATLLVRSFVNLVSEDRGFDPSRILVAQISLPTTSFPTPESRTIAAQLLEERVRELPGVSLSTWSYGTPPGGGVTLRGDWTSDVPGAPQASMSVGRYFVGPEFFSLYGIPVLRGRSLRPTDTSKTVLVSERFARAFGAGVDPIGRTFTFGKRQFEVIGLVSDLRFPSLDRTLDGPQLYELYGGVSNSAMLSVRCGGTCPEPVLVRQRLAAALPSAHVDSVRALADAYDQELVRPRAAAALAFGFAVTALIAAAVGLLGLLSQSLARRRREFGIRLALGASPASIRSLVWRDGLSVTLTGIVVGTLAGVSLERALSSLLFGVTTSDAPSWAIVVGTLAVTIVAASWGPTRVAGRLAPTVLLRDE